MMSQLWMPKWNQPDRRAQSDLPLSTQVLTLGNDHIVSFAGTSQFTAQGVSACGLAAFNFARIGFRIERSKKSLADILNELGTKDVIEEIVAICAGWSSDLHLEADDIHDLPLFSRSLRLTSVEYGSPRPKHFQTLLRTMKEIDTSAVMIITRPPEIIACFKFANAHGGAAASSSTKRDDTLFVVFDSHPRTSHPDGAGLSFSTSIESTARTLSDILPTMDEGVFDEADYQWQAQLLSNCSAHVYVGRHRRKDQEEAVVQSSLNILTLRAQISALRRENETLDVENQKLGSEVDQLRVSVRLEQMKAEPPPPIPASSKGFWNRKKGFSYGLISHAVAGPSRSGGSGSGVQKPWGYDRVTDAPSASRAKPHTPPPARMPAVGPSGAQSIFANNPPPAPSKTPPTFDDFDLDDKSGEDPDELWLQNALAACELRDKFDLEDQQLRETASAARRLQDKLNSEERSRQRAASTARDLQNQFDSEDRRLRREQEELAKFVQATFECSICLDELPEEDIAKVDICMHSMCRTCLREFVSSKIQEHRYPIFCPVCTISAEDKGQPGVISRLLIEQLGVSEEQSQVLMEMELAEFTIQIHCRKCQRHSFVDREDYSDAVNIVCPQHDCHHVWCRKCDQTIVVDGPTHSCDGSNELAHLMDEKGWKRCPNCTTAILKEMGCNHMTCISPGCNTHFCYVCGGMIVRSALSREIGEAVSAHFRKCQLFEVPN